MVTQKDLKPGVATEISVFTRKVKKSGIPVDKIIVFGSQATHLAKPWSDIDICVVSKTFGKNRHDERLKLMMLTDKECIDIEPHPYHPADLKNKWDLLAHEINKHGIIIE